MVATSAKHVVEILSCAECVGLAVSVQNNEHLIQMAHSGLLSECSLSNPKVYSKVSRTKLAVLTVGRNDQHEWDPNRSQ